MAFVNENSPVVALPELEVFENISVQTSIEDTVVQELIPQSQLNSGGHHEFIITTHENEYLRFQDMILQTKFKVKIYKNDATAIVENDWKSVSLINNPGESLWAQIDVSIGEVATNKPLHTYPFRAYIHTLINGTKEAKDTFLKLRGWTEDDFSTQAKIIEPNSSRSELISYLKGDDKSIGRSCEFWTKLNVDLFQQRKNLIGGLTVKIRLIPSRPELLFMISNEKIIPKVIYESIILHTPIRKIDGDVCVGILRGLNLSPAKYPVNRIEVRSHTIDTGTTSRNLENIYTGTAPRRVYICFVNNSAYSGHYKKNPFYFHHYNIASLACFVNSVMVNRRPYQPDYDLKYLGYEYFNFLKVTGQYNNNILTTITPEQYKNGYTIFAFDLTRDNSEGFLKSGYVDPPSKFSNLRFTIHFKEALTETISAIVYSEWDDIIMIDNLKNALVSAE